MSGPTALLFLAFARTFWQNWSVHTIYALEWAP